MFLKKMWAAVPRKNTGDMGRRLIPRRRRGIAAYSWTVENALDTHHGLPSLIRGLSGMVLPSVVGTLVGQAQCCKKFYN